ncbi:MAG: sulfotransferase family protein [Alphaproteobacteria bacterium]|nr:sulfotransferase family protein [Alphaproteobacteria bacterium]MBV9062507.1 sulfotransferase family protein [Alphaproteobacteria bacterium]
MPLDVIGAGLGRTGTMTLKTALEKLGFAPCHHMYEVIQHPEQAAFWEAAARGEPVDWEEVFAGYRASCDWPSCAFYKELAARYPAAKVVLTLRDPHAWYRSVCNTILPAMKGPIVLPDGSRAGPPGDFAALLIGEKTFGNDFSEEHMVAVFNRHNEEVKRRIPPERLLVFEAAQGWEPLCSFLGVPVPSEPFPLTNTTGEFKKRIEERQRQSAQGAA